MSTLRAKKLCCNCISPGYFERQYTSIHKCNKYQNPHHTLLHLDRGNISSTPGTVTTPPAPSQDANPQVGTSANSTPLNVSGSINSPYMFSATTVSMKHNLLVTCCVRVNSPNGLNVITRALLDNVSLISFVSEHLAQSLNLPRTKRDVVISGVAALPIGSKLISSLHSMFHQSLCPQK